jgi:hypothetical protein
LSIEGAWFLLQKDMISSPECIAYLCSLAHQVPGIEEESRRRGVIYVPEKVTSVTSGMAAALLHQVFDFPLSPQAEPFHSFVLAQSVHPRDLLMLEEPKSKVKTEEKAVAKQPAKQEDIDFFL